MATEAAPEARRRRIKLSTAPTTQASVDVAESVPPVVVAAPAEPRPLSRRRLESSQRTFDGSPAIREISTSIDTSHGPTTFTGRGRLRDAVIARAKVSAETKIQKGWALNAEDQLNFFTGNWDGVPREKIWPDETKQLPPPSEEAEAVGPREEGVTSDGAPLLVSDLRFRKDILQRNAGISITLRKEQIEAEEKVLSFVPAGVPHDAVPGGNEVRLLEDEGFYVGDRPVMAQRNVDRMRERLLHQTAPDRAPGWFDESGQPLALPDPLRNQPLRILPLTGSRGEKPVVYRKAVAEGTKVVADDSDMFRLEIAIGRLQFSHHYLFSGEHALASRLHELYSAFVDWQSRDLIAYWRQQLDAVRLAVSAIANELAAKVASDDPEHSQPQPPANGNEIGELRLRYDTYSAQIMFIRKQLNAEMSAELSLTRGVIGAWRNLKDHRKTIGHVITGWKLVINRMNLSNEEVEREANEWRRDIEDEVEEIYRFQLREFERSNNNAAANATGPTMVAERPDRDAIRVKVLQRVTEQRRQPGSPRLGFDLQQNGVPVTPLEQLPRPEQNRRQDVMRTNVWLRVMVGTSVLSETNRRPLGNDFSVEFDYSFPILLSDLPETIAVEIHESSTSVLATVYIPIPDATCLSNRPYLEPYEFTCPNEFPPASSSTAVGSGLPFGQPLVSGSLKTGAAWSADNPPPASVTHGINALNARATAHVMDATRIREMISSGALDPNHPNNVELVYLLRSSPSVGATPASSAAYFRLEHLLEEFSFVPDDTFAKSNRFRILELRDKEIDDFRKLKMIPADERDADVGMLRRWQAQQVDSSIFGTAQKQPSTASDQPADKDEATAEFDIAAQAVGGLHEFEVQRIRGAKHLQRARQAVLQQLNIAAHKLSLVDVVFEDDVPSIRTGLEALGRVFEPRRPLMPKRIPRKKIPGQNLQPGDVSLIVSVLRATIRLPQQGSSLGPPEGLRIYAEVSFQEKTEETSVAMGVEPTWNEKMTFPFRAPNDDFSPASLQSANDFIYILIFARRIKVLEHEARGDASVVVQRFERRWLGTLKLRWSAVYLNTTIEGTFYVSQVEPSLLGTNQLLVSVYATLSPALLLPEGPPSNLPTSEEASLIERAEAFSQRYTQRFQQREVLLTVIDVTGKRVFVSRYLRKIRPPQELIGNNSGDRNTVDRRVSRFVSLFPFVSDTAVFPVQIDVWATAEQFVKMLSGDDEEHACLLASYLLYLDRIAYLAVGSAIPEGRSTYVISEVISDSQGSKFVAWEPKSGLPCDLTDPFCPLQTIDCIITADNVYANIQHSNRSAETSMNLADKKLWEPFFNPGEFTKDSAPLELGGDAVGNEQLAKSKEAALRLRLIIRDAIHRELNKLREPGRNALNRLLSHKVQEHLQSLEAQLRDGTPIEFDELTTELERYGVSGFTLQQPFTSVGAIIDAVRATRVWQISDPEVTYVLAVHVEPYPMTILAVWVYIGVQSISPNAAISRLH